MKRPPFISSDLNNEMMNLLELFPLFFAVLKKLNKYYKLGWKYYI